MGVQARTRACERACACVRARARACAYVHVRVSVDMLEDYTMELKVSGSGLGF